MTYCETKNDMIKINIQEYLYIENYNYNSSTEYKMAIRFLKLGCNCDCTKKILRKKLAKLREAFQTLSRSEQDIFLMKQ